MIRTFIKRCLIFGVPIWFLLLLYVISDPFKVIYDYDRYYSDKNYNIPLNGNVVGTSLYNKHRNIYNYDSFIFGNSRSRVFEIENWKKYIDNSASCFHYDSNGDVIYSIWKKIKYIDCMGDVIKNGLLILDKSTFDFSSARNGHMYNIPPELEHYRNFFEFHYTSFLDYCNMEFLLPYIYYLITDDYKEMCDANLLWGPMYGYEERINELKYIDEEELISKGEFYTPEKITVFKGKQYPDSISAPVIVEAHKLMLTEISEIFDRHKTNYRIIISPLYNQIKISEEDINILENIFDKKYVFDFSGKNQMTDDYRNYYEDSHYRPIVADKIMEIIYTKD